MNARHVKNVPGRKGDVSDCQWLQRLHTYGLLSGSFRPDDQICVLRSYWRHRDNLVRYASAHIQHMQKAMTEINLHLHKVLSNVTGVTGMNIIRAIIAGVRIPEKLALMTERIVCTVRASRPGIWVKSYWIAGNNEELWHYWSWLLFVGINESATTVMNVLMKITKETDGSFKNAKFSSLGCTVIGGQLNNLPFMATVKSQGRA